mmetsp:Transcript_8721/g.14816  ORF Transcript_8721/g.14816 Transcript_8721/m.14816 type:complete len:411 (+) Transcript_8721:64-1296(+)|eukprot:CAMPEP_0114464038 /NCGR_PEP_ID=MMETSP0104-20121206/7693_1 /TAXON_ID=37642 ORGANISM="Paraphysomonas imperforata, Strain PA2" /NCGR_SAMPLE_ID=MMETSP0104 /ASSEMBLY_ACC=CAM_ASM_000202 /LENGTH=410 /DNA_ID=CAMNT_0001637045 /DNA_START=70 /DNA_END=1302 /DNA_ORIENTATION=+
MFRAVNSRFIVVAAATSSLSILTTIWTPQYARADNQGSDFISSDSKYMNKSLLSYSNSSLKQQKTKREAKLKDIVLIGGTKHPALSEEVASILNIDMADTKISRFSDGECAIRVMQEVRGRCVYIIQPCGEDVSDSIIELLLTISTVKRAGCKSVTAVIPYFPFKHYRRGMPKSKKLHSKFLISGPTDFGKMLEAMDVDRVISVALQRPGQGQEACFFDNSIPLEDISTTHLTTTHFKEHIPLDGPIVFMSPNDECLKKAVKFEKKFAEIYPDSKISIIASVHRGTSVYKDNAGDFEILGKFDVKGANVIIVDDIIQSGVTVTEMSKLAKSKGAKKVFVCASHASFSRDAMRLLQDSPIDEILVTNTLPAPDNLIPKVKQLSVAPLLARVIWAEHFKNSLIDEDYEIETL